MSVLVDFGNFVGGNLGVARQMARLFFPREYKIGDIKIDTVIDENHTSSASITTYPVEIGAAMTDHIQSNPVTLSMQCLVSDISSDEDLDIGVTGLFDYGVGGIVGEIANRNNTDDDRNTRSMEAWKQLEQVKSNAELITIETTLKTYKNMAITSLGCTRDKDTSQAIFFSITCEEVRSINFATSGNSATLVTDAPETEIAKNNQSTADKVQKKTDAGKVKPKDTGNPESLLYKGVEYIGGLF